MDFCRVPIRPSKGKFSLLDKPINNVPLEGGKIVLQSPGAHGIREKFLCRQYGMSGC